MDRISTCLDNLSVTRLPINIPSPTISRQQSLNRIHAKCGTLHTFQGQAVNDATTYKIA